MAASDPAFSEIRAAQGTLALEPLTAADIPDCLALVEEAGWNQCAEDWALMLAPGFGRAARDGGRVVATGLALPYPPGFGWISMILVHGPYRRRGLASALLARAIADLQRHGLVPVLDATPAGRLVYEPLGFLAVEGLSRWRREEGAAGGCHRFPAVAGDDLEWIATLDRRAFGADRSNVLVDLAGRGGLALHDGHRRGFLLSRSGRRATQLGPLVCEDSEPALQLLESALDTVEGPVVVDVPDACTEVAALLSSRGFAVERPYTRMALGRSEPFGEPRFVHAIAGPELG